MNLFERLRGKATRARPDSTTDYGLFAEEFLHKLEMLALASRRAASGVRRGDRRSKKKGSGVEFADHRSYVAGDDIRLLDHGVYQRLGKLLLRVYEEEEDLSLYFLIDCSGSMGMAGKLRQAARLTAALGYIGLANLERVSVVALFGDKPTRLPATRGRQRVFKLLRFLSTLRPAGATHLSDALQGFVASRPRRGLAVLLTDLYDPAGFRAGINVLRFNRFEVCLLHLVSPEDALTKLRGDATLVDVETGAQLVLTVTERAERAAQTAKLEFENQVQRFCVSRAVAYFRVDSAAPLDDVVLTVLRRGGLLT